MSIEHRSGLDTFALAAVAAVSAAGDDDDDGGDENSIQFDLIRFDSKQFFVVVPFSRKVNEGEVVLGKGG